MSDIDALLVRATQGAGNWTRPALHARRVRVGPAWCPRAAVPSAPRHPAPGGGVAGRDGDGWCGVTPLSSQCPTCRASIGVPCRPDGGTCRHRGAVLVTRPCVVCDGDRHAVDGAMHECVRCGARSWPAVEVAS